MPPEQLLSSAPETLDMRCPSCNASYGDSDCCSECGAVAQSTAKVGEEQGEFVEFSEPKEPSPNQTSKKSTLIEFPGVVRSTVPEWRRELSERVREVQERRAREAAAEAAAAERLRLEQAAAAPPPQLELLPQATTPTMNPLVAAALRRIERANQRIAQTSSVSHAPLRATAAAIAYAPEDELESTPDKPTTTPASAPELEPANVLTKPSAEKTHNLVVVPPLETTVSAKTESPTVTRRLISDNDPALNYLDSVPTSLRFDEPDTRRAGVMGRLTAAVIDLLLCGLLFSPFIALVQLTNGDWQRLRTIVLATAISSAIVFLYMTFTTALTGHTLGMRLLSLRTIDKRTGLIPTGGQSVGRAFIYTATLAAAGLPILYVLFSREGYTLHDRLTGTVVVRA